MKKIILLLILLSISGTTKAQYRIQRKEWDNLRDIHAWYVQNVKKEKWDPRKTDTNAFLKETLKPYFLKTVEKNQELAEQNQKLTEERNKVTMILWCLAVIILILSAVIVLIIIWFRPRKAVKPAREAASSVDKTRTDILPEDDFPSSDKLRCPRCGSERRPEETECKRCKTHF